jgi:leucyl aminopeptidase
MRPRALDCLATPGAPAREVHAIRPAELAAFLGRCGAADAARLRAQGFAAAEGEGPLLFGPEHGLAAVIGLGADRGPSPFGELAHGLPEGDWQLAPGDYDPDLALLGFCLGAYTYSAYKTPKRAAARVLAPAGAGNAARLAETIWFVRDLINTPANALGPAELADAAAVIAAEHGASFQRVEGDDVRRNYPALYSVGAGSDRPPVVAILRWHAADAASDAPLVSLCGKGVVFDTGGLDLKPSAGMLRMKKDMGGAAIMLGLARVLMASGAPIRLELRLGCVENAVSGRSMRPGDILRTRAGLTVELGNTDAEGRLVLADLLTEAAEAAPSLLLDCATLTGAARVAVGPDLPVLFSNDEDVATALLRGGEASYDPLWRLPLWDAYDKWLESEVADLNNVSSQSHAGSITAALFLRRFVPGRIRWAHIDAYAWNDKARPGRPQGGEAQALRAMLDGIGRALHTIA